MTEYQLTVRVENKDSLAAAITIEFKIEDVNDEIPDFVDIVTGSVLENEEPPAEVMQVKLFFNLIYIFVESFINTIIFGCTAEKELLKNTFVDCYKQLLTIHFLIIELCLSIPGGFEK